MRKKFLLIVFALYVFLISCASTEIEPLENGIQNFDVNPNGGLIVAWTINNVTKLYKSNSAGYYSRVLTTEDKNDSTSFFNPKISLDGLKIAFISRQPTELGGSIGLINMDGDSIKQLTDTSHIKLEMIFANDNNKIIFTQANDYTSYSPVGSTAAHNFDVYSIGLDGIGLRRITSLATYSMYGLAELDSNKIVFSDFSQSGRNLYIYDTDKQKSSKIKTLKYSLAGENEYSSPIIISKNKLICLSFSRLTEINLVTNAERQILPALGDLKFIRFNAKLNKLFFVKTNKNGVIYSINLDGSQLKRHPILIK